MKQIDFSSDRIAANIFRTAIPLLVAQILNLLYNIVDRIYIARIADIGTVALGAVGLCFPIIIIITAFTNLFGSGGSPLFSIARGRGDKKEAGNLMDLSFLLLIITAIILTIAGELFSRPILTVFGASAQAMQYALPYLRIYLCGTLFSMIGLGMNPFINAQGFPAVGMFTVVIGAACNLILDPVFIFVLGFGVSGAAIATVISQIFSACFVLWFLFSKKPEYRLHLLSPAVLRKFSRQVKDIISLGTASFIMYLTNGVVQICCNSVLVRTGGDLYVSVMTILSSIRQLLETPVFAFADGTSPIISYNYGAKKARSVRKAIWIMSWIFALYTGLVWLLIVWKPVFFISIFSSDKTILADTIPALHTYFFAFIFMTLQHSGQTTFKSLGQKKPAIFFSLFRKAIIVIPLTYILPYLFKLGTNGVFMAEPISNVIGGTACFITMLVTVLPELKKMEQKEKA